MAWALVILQSQVGQTDPSNFRSGGKIIFFKSNGSRMTFCVALPEVESEALWLTGVTFRCM